MKHKTLKTLSLFTVLSMVLTLFTAMPQSSAGAETVSGKVEINETNFPDQIFRNHVKDNIDTNHDNYLSEEEIQAVTELNLQSKSITSLKGVEYFTELTYLDCGKNQLTELDISRNTKLRLLYCYENELSKLDVSNNNKLYVLRFNNNNLTSIDLSANTELEILDCNHNKLTSIDLSANIKLKELDCSYNKLTKLDLSACTILRHIRCNHNSLTSLDLSKNNTYDPRPDDFDDNVYETGSCQSFDLAELKQYGFDITKASNWDSQPTDDNKLICLSSGQTVTYQYDCGSDEIATFNIKFSPHSVKPIEGKQATCTKPGYEACYECSECKNKFKDEACTELAETIKPLGHDYKDHICTRCNMTDISKSISPSSAEIKIGSEGKTFNLTNFSSEMLVWKSEPSGIIEISKFSGYQCVVTGIKPGTCKLIAEYNNEIIAESTITVTGYSIRPITPNYGNVLFPKDIVSFEVYGDTLNASDEWDYVNELTNETGVTGGLIVNSLQGGLCSVTAEKPGIYTLIVRLDDKEAARTEIRVLGITPDETVLTLGETETVRIIAETDEEAKNIPLTCSGDGITCKNNGDGTYDITANEGGVYELSAVINERTLKAQIRVPKLSAEYVVLLVDDKKEIKAEGLTEADKACSWVFSSSSGLNCEYNTNLSIVTVTALEVGEYKFTCAYAGKSVGDGIIKVIEAKNKYDFTPSSATITVGETQEFNLSDVPDSIKQGVSVACQPNTAKIDYKSNPDKKIWEITGIGPGSCYLFEDNATDSLNDAYLTIVPETLTPSSAALTPNSTQVFSIEGDYDMDHFNVEWSIEPNNGDVGIFPNKNYKNQCEVYVNKTGDYTLSALINGEKTVQATITHDHNLEKQDPVPPTCTDTGTGEYYICSQCGKMFSDEAGNNEITEPPVTSATGHNWGAWDYFHPGETFEGKKERTCLNDESHTETITVPMLSDTSVWEITKEVPPTCSKEGYRIYKSDLYQEILLILRKLSHDYGPEDQQWHFDSENHWRECVNCRGKDSEFAHQWDKGTETVPPAVGKEGVMTYACEICGHTKTEKIPALDPEETTEKEPSPDTGSSEPAPDTSGSEPNPGTSDTEPAPDTSDTEPEPGTSETEPAPDTSDTEPEPDTSDTEPAPDTSDTEPAPDTSDTEPAPDTSDTEPAPDTSDTEPAPDTSDTYPVPPDTSYVGGFTVPETTTATETAATAETETAPADAAESTSAPAAETDGGSETLAPALTPPDTTLPPPSDGGAPAPDVVNTGNIAKTALSGANAPKASLFDSPAELAEKVLDPADIALVNGGAAVEILLSVDNITDSVPEGDKTAAEETLKTLSSYNIAQYLDITLTKTVNGSSKKISETKAPVTVTVEVPEALRKQDREFKLIRVHNGESAVLDDLDDNPDTVTAETDRFSSYAVIYRDKAKPDGAENAENGENNQNTGVESYVIFFAATAMGALSLLTLLHFTTGRNGLSEARKERTVRRIIEWGKKGGRLRRYVAIIGISVVLVFYYGIGEKNA